MEISTSSGVVSRMTTLLLLLLHAPHASAFTAPLPGTITTTTSASCRQLTPITAMARSSPKNQLSAKEIREAERAEQLRKRQSGIDALKKIAGIMKERCSRKDAMARGEPIPGIGKQQPRSNLASSAPGTTAIANAKSQDEKWAEAYALAEKQLKEEDEEGFDVGQLAETLGELAVSKVELAVLRQRDAVRDALIEQRDAVLEQRDALLGRKGSPPE